MIKVEKTFNTKEEALAYVAQRYRLEPRCESTEYGRATGRSFLVAYDLEEETYVKWVEDGKKTRAYQRYPNSTVAFADLIKLVTTGE